MDPLSYVIGYKQGEASGGGSGDVNVVPITITENGLKIAPSGKAYSPISVNVENSYDAEDEGKVVNNGALVAQTAHAEISANGTYDTTLNDEVTVNVSSGSAPVVQALSVTQNGTYTPSSGVDGFSSVTVSVGGSGGGGPVYYGTSEPDASMGQDEDLFIQYAVKASTFDHTYEITAQFRKVNGVWVLYTIPELPTQGVHIWTKSTNPNDAAMYVQNGYWDVDNNVFVETKEAESISHRSVQSWASAKNCNGIALLAYPSNWNIKASVTITDGINTYQPDTTVASWGYTGQRDIYLWKPMS